MTTETRQRDSDRAGHENGGWRLDGAGGVPPRERKAQYAALIGAYGTAVGSFLAWRELTGRGLPRRIGGRDLALLGAATHKVSRLIAKDKVTTPLRAPFTRVEPEEEAERPRGRGLRRTIGELVACPYCLDMWIATGFSAAMVSAPRQTRFVATIFSTVAIADFLQAAYRATEEMS